MVILLVEGDSSETLEVEVFLVVAEKLSDLGPKRAFFRADGVPFVADLASDKMFRMAGDNLVEIDGLDIKLKISLEGAIMDETEAIKWARSSV